MWYKQQSIEGKIKRSYLPKSEHDTAKRLAEKTYKIHLLEDKKNELKSICAYLKLRKPERYSKYHDPNTPNVVKIKSN